LSYQTATSLPYVPGRFEGDTLVESSLPQVCARKSRTCTFDAERHSGLHATGHKAVGKGVVFSDDEVDIHHLEGTTVPPQRESDGTEASVGEGRIG